MLYLVLRWLKMIDKWNCNKKYCEIHRFLEIQKHRKQHEDRDGNYFVFFLLHFCHYTWELSTTSRIFLLCTVQLRYILTGLKKSIFTLCYAKWFCFKQQENLWQQIATCNCCKIIKITGICLYKKTQTIETKACRNWKQPNIFTVLIII